MQVTRGLIAAAILTTAGGTTGVSLAGPPSPKQELAATAAVAEKPTLPSVRGLVGKLSCTVDVFEVSGCPAFLIRAKDPPADSPTPWVWYAPIIKNPSANPAWMLQQWLAKGIGMAGIDV